MCNAQNGLPIELLIIENNPGDVDLIRAALRRCKSAVNATVARNGVQALAMLRRQREYAQAPRPDMILLDLNLPMKSGTEVLAEIKQDPELRRIPVAILTSSQAEEDVLQAYDLHANCFLTKPMDLAQFRRVVQCIDDFWFSAARLPGVSATPDLNCATYAFADP